MSSPGAVAASAPPAVAVHAVQRARPEAALAFAHAVTEAHYETGLDPNDPAAYAALLAEHAPGVTLPDLHDPALAEAAFAEGRALGIRAFPTFLLDRGGRLETVPTLYDPDALVAEVGRRAA
jgi:protein-disulfide isomerase-like protein with CxxC motif